MACSKPQKKVLMLCADAMEDYEAIVPFQALQAYGVQVDAVCPGKMAGDVCRTVKYKAYSSDSQMFPPPTPDWLRTYIELPGHNFILNATFDDIEVTSYDGLIIPGARGPEYLATFELVRDVVRNFLSCKKPIAAICHALLLLTAADPNSIRDRKCTGFPTMRPVAHAAGAQWVEPESREACVVDGNLITAALYASHPEYIGLFIKALGGLITGSKKRILLLGGDSMAEYDGIVPFQSLQVVGCEVHAVCSNKTKDKFCPTAVHEYEGDNSNFSEKPGLDFRMTADFDGINPLCYDGLVIAGGRAPEYYALDDKVLVLVQKFVDLAKPIASIGYGQLILAAADVLKGRKCTAHPCAKVNVELAKAIWLEPKPKSRCYTDGNLVTGSGWQGHPELICQFMALLDIQVSFK